MWNAAGGSSVPQLRISNRARRIAIRVLDDASVELVVPRGVSPSRAQAFLASRSEWVKAAVERRRQHAAPEEPWLPEWLDLAAVGERWRVHLAGGTGRPRLVERPGRLLSLSGEATRLQWRTRLLAWLAAKAQQEFEPRLRELAQQHGFSFRVLSIRAQRSRWGSCSTRGTISINLAMLFQRPEVLRYLMCHELAHTRHMNHSAAFWRCVEGCEPLWQTLDRELSQGGRRLPRLLSRRLPEGA